mmetsp:Transcript_76560/g.212660  ORF Transcript_76560/g.212660 Transcript_76560/m.212660 type:complete len:244 (+) Transcript_76560:850-1581(+)
MPEQQRRSSTSVSAVDRRFTRRSSQALHQRFHKLGVARIGDILQRRNDRTPDLLVRVAELPEERIRNNHVAAFRHMRQRLGGVPRPLPGAARQLAKQDPHDVDVTTVRNGAQSSQCDLNNLLARVAKQHDQPRSGRRVAPVRNAADRLRGSLADEPWVLLGQAQKVGHNILITLLGDLHERGNGVLAHEFTRVAESPEEPVDHRGVRLCGELSKRLCRLSSDTIVAVVELFDQLCDATRRPDS